MTRYLCPGEQLGKKGHTASSLLHLQQLGITGIQVNEVSLDSAYIKVHPDGMGALKKAPILSGERKADGKFHMLSASDRGGVILALCPWNCNDAPEGRAFLRQLGLAGHPIGLMRGTRHRLWQWNLGYIPVISPKSGLKNTWSNNK